MVGLTGFTLRRGGTAPDFAGWKRTGIEERMQLIREAAGDRYDRLD